ncbi:hypothetical protein D3C85_1578950 [compost metagenome]
MWRSSGLGCTVIPFAPKRSQARAAANTFGLFPPRELRRVAILLMFTDNAVMLISIF